MAHKNICSWIFIGLFIALAFGILFHQVAVAKDILKANAKGYIVKTVLDGNKMGPISFGNILEVVTNEGVSVIALNTPNSTILRLPLPFSQTYAWMMMWSMDPDSIVERIAGSSQGERGYQDGSVEKALFAQPKSLTIDNDGTIYVADSKNRAVRMITKEGIVTTIAGGSNKIGHQDGEGIEVTFSYDFEVTYLQSTCTLAVADKGNRMIREIQLPQFVGRCQGIAPNSQKKLFISVTFVACMVLGIGIIGIIAGGLVAILTLSTERLEQLQSKFMRDREHNEQNNPQLNAPENDNNLTEVLINSIEDEKEEEDDDDSLEESFDDSIFRHQ